LKTFQTSFGRLVLLGRVCSVLLGFASVSHGTEPFWTVVEHVPRFVGVNMDAGIYMLVRGHALNGYDLRSKGERWSVKIKNARLYPRSGKTLVAVPKQDGTLTVMRMDTGEEAWRYRNRNFGMPDYMEFIGNTDWLQLMFVREYDNNRGMPVRFVCLLYAPDGNSYFRLPEDHSTNVISPDEKTAFLTCVKKQTPELGKVSSLALDTGTITPRFEVNSKECLGIADVLDSNESLVMEYRQIERERSYSLVNAQTGTLIHPITLPEKKLGGLKVYSDRNQLLFMSDKMDTLWLQDTTSGAITHARQKEGHRFLMLGGVKMDSNGNLWTISRESNGSLWLWQVDADSEPRQLLDSSNYIGWGIGGSPFYYGHFLHSIRGTEDSLLLAKRLDDLTVTSQWILPGMDISWTRPIPSESMGRVLLSIDVQSKVFESGQSKPVLELEGEPLAFSPDGRHALIKQKNKAIIVAVDMGIVVSSFSLDEYGYAHAAFSRDSRLLAIYWESSIKVVRLEGDYPVKDLYFPKEKERGYISWENGLCFTPDNRKLLAPGYGRAWIFDVETGACLKTLVENARFLRSYSHSPSVLAIKIPFLNTIEDFAGGFTDHFKRPPSLGGSFILDGSKLVTNAQGNLLHVWDTATGQSVRTIQTELPEVRNEDGHIFNRAVLSPNGAFAFAFNDDQGIASLFDVTTGRTLRQYKDDRTKGVYQVYVADDGEVYLYNTIGLCRLSLKR
jgi:WD40 repeat protein